MCSDTPDSNYYSAEIALGGGKSIVRLSISSGSLDASELTQSNCLHTPWVTSSRCFRVDVLDCEIIRCSQTHLVFRRIEFGKFVR
jgi:hypothetical protein